MKTKRFLSLFVAVLLCFSSFQSFVKVAATDIEIDLDEIYADDSAEESDVSSKELSDDPTHEVAVPSEDTVDDPSEELAALPEDKNDNSIDYSDMSNWAYWNVGEDKTADLFFVCPTVDMGRDGNFIADINNEKYRKSFVGATNMELGIYDDEASVYAPYYRQATFPVYNLSEEEREVYLDYAYKDVKDAFIYYSENSDPTRPLILAGFSQGADLIIRLIKDLFDDPLYQRRLVAAYAVGWKLTEDEVKEYPHLVPAQGEDDTGVIVAFNSEAPEVTSSLMVGENEKTYAINPLNWKTNSEVADKSLNKGACFTEYSGNIKEEVPEFTGAYLDEKRGTLKVTDVDKEKYSSSMFDKGVYHLNDYQFFFRNLEENVKARLSAYKEKYADRIDVFYLDDLICFDVEPIIENGRTIVPFRAIFEAMGCAVYYAEADGKQIVTAKRADDVLMLTIGDDKMYFNGKEITLDVPARIKDGRTLVPLRAIFEAFECSVEWIEEIRTILIQPPFEAYEQTAKMFTETIKDDEGNVLVEAVAFYPSFYNFDEISYLDEINSECKWDAEKFMEEARAKKEDAKLLRQQMGENFTPFVYELTYEIPYNIYGDISIVNHKYINIGGAHPTKVLDSRSFDMGLEEEHSVSTVIDEEKLGVSLSDYVINLFVKKLEDIAPDFGETFTYDYVKEWIGYIKFYLKPNSLVLYLNQGEAAPYALGVISVEVPYDEELFQVDMSVCCLDEYVYELEFDKGYEWVVASYEEARIEVSEEVVEYDPETLLSEYYPVGMKKITVKGKAKGDAGMLLVHLEEGKGFETATKMLIPRFYVDEACKLTLVVEDDGTYLIDMLYK